MKFPYRKEPSLPGTAHENRTEVFRPRIPIRLFHKNRFIDVLALIDSGADDCIFPLEVATELNLPLDARNVNHYGGIGSGSIKATFANVRVGIEGGAMFPLYVGFSDAPSVVPILGQAGFFDRFEVTFNKRNEMIGLKPIN